MNIDQIIRTKRKTIAIIVRSDGKVIVRAPYRLSEARIMAFVEEKQDWIEKRLAQTRFRRNQTTPRLYQAGEKLPFMGRQVLLEVSQNGKSWFDYTNDRFILCETDRARAERIITAWYRKQARQIIEQRVDLYAKQFHFQYTRVRISSARTRWGSCSQRGTLSFCWRLVMAPLEVLDYVVLHELTHLVEPNHSSRFWERLGVMLPDYSQHRRWLKICGPSLALEILPEIELFPCSAAFENRL